MYSRFFHFPPYNRFAPWREDSEYRVAVVSPVGMGPKGEDGQDLTWESMSDADKQNLADKIQDKLNKGDKGDSAYVVAMIEKYGEDPEQWEETEAEWIASLKGDPGADGAFSMLDDDSKEAAAAALAPMVIDVDWGEYVAEHLDDIVTQARQGVIGNIYPVGALYFTMADLGETGPSILGFPGNWVQIQDRFLYASTGEAGVEGGATNGNITLTVGQLPAHTHSLNNGTNTPKFVHNHNLGGDALVRPTGGLYSTSGKTRQRYVYNKTQNKLDPITSFTRQSTISAEGTHYDGRAIIFNSNRLTNDSIAAGKATPNYVETGPVKNNSWTGSLATTGSGDQVNIMPPYITVHVWQRMPDSVTSESQESDGESGNDGEANYGTIWEGEN